MNKTAPKWLSENAKREWRRLYRLQGRLQGLQFADEALICSYCEASATLQESSQLLLNPGEPLVYDGPNGAKCANPLVQIQAKAMHTIARLSILLGMQPRVTGTPGETVNPDEGDIDNFAEHGQDLLGPKNGDREVDEDAG